MFNMFDTVKSIIDIPELGLKSGAIGAIIDIYYVPTPAYEIEFFDLDDQVVGTISMKPGQVVAMQKVSSSKFPERLAA